MEEVASSSGREEERWWAQVRGKELPLAQVEAQKLGPERVLVQKLASAEEEVSWWEPGEERQQGLARAQQVLELALEVLPSSELAGGP